MLTPAGRTVMRVADSLEALADTLSQPIVDSKQNRQWVAAVVRKLAADLRVALSEQRPS